jgi:hypothetical protein
MVPVVRIAVREVDYRSPNSSEGGENRFFYQIMD